MNLETEEQFLFSGGGVDRCKEGDTQDSDYVEKMAMPTQGRKRTAIGGGHRADGGKNQRTAEDHVGFAGIKCCSINNELGAVAGHSSFIKFWRASRA